MDEYKGLIIAQEETMQFIESLKSLSKRGGDISTMSTKMLNELQLALAGVKICEKN